MRTQQPQLFYFFCKHLCIALGTAAVLQVVVIPRTWFQLIPTPRDHSNDATVVLQKIFDGKSNSFGIRLSFLKGGFHRLCKIIRNIGTIQHDKRGRRIRSLVDELGRRLIIGLLRRWFARLALNLLAVDLSIFMGTLPEYVVMIRRRLIGQPNDILIHTHRSVHAWRQYLKMVVQFKQTG